MEPYPGFQSRLPYNLDINFDIVDAERISFESEDIRTTPGTATLNVIPYKARGQVRLNWTIGTSLLSGRYQDIIRIRVTGDGSTKSHW